VPHPRRLVHRRRQRAQLLLQRERLRDLLPPVRTGVEELQPSEQVERRAVERAIVGPARDRRCLAHRLDRFRPPPGEAGLLGEADAGPHSWSGVAALGHRLAEEVVEAGAHLGRGDEDRGARRPRRQPRLRPLDELRDGFPVARLGVGRGGPGGEAAPPVEVARAHELAGSVEQLRGRGGRAAPLGPNGGFLEQVDHLGLGAAVAAARWRACCSGSRTIRASLR
jgi:hypothetical protein